MEVPLSTLHQAPRTNAPIFRALLLVFAILVLTSASALAQTGDTAVAAVNTPVYVAADSSRTPLRVAAQGTTFEVMGEQGEWTQVRFQDPQWGPRVGYVATKDLRFRRAALEPMDLSVTPKSPAVERPAPAATPAPAAEVPRPAHHETAPWPHSYIVGRGGLTFGTRTAPLVGVEVGGQVAPMLQAYGSFDWHRDISPSFVEDISQLVSDIVGADVNYRFPAWTAVGGVKVIAPRGRVRPYGLGGLGYGRVNGTIEVEGEDVTKLLDDLGYIDRNDFNFNKVLFEVGGGMSASTGRVYVDISYRFRKFLQTSEPINVSGLYAGAGVGF
jgi:opacity protein-like surface antigen